MKENNQFLGIYVHIPFCVKKCLYCDFYSSVGSSVQMEQYAKSLIREVNQSAEELGEKTVDTIFIGGGTPSLMEVSYLHGILRAVSEKFSMTEEAEVSIECNPGTVTREKLRAYWKMGINRISFGLQSAVDGELKALGRIHSYEDFLKSWKWAREEGFLNINVDLMSGIPGQTRSSFEGTCKRILELKPEHISAYSLILEQGTPFYEKYKRNPPMCEETELEIYHQTRRILTQAGYERYEISNYAKNGLTCKHNLKYWSQEDYIGFGSGASSMINNKRWKNTEAVYEYGKHGIFEKCELERLEKKEKMEEYVIFGLRKIVGVSLLDFKERFGEDLTEVFKKPMEKYIGFGFMQIHEGRLFFTERGMDVSNMILPEFLE